MRTFEIALLVVNMVMLVLCFTKPSIRLWLGIVGMNLLALLVHGAVEGFRYQLAFSYVLVVLLVVHAVAHRWGVLANIHVPRAVRPVSASVAVVLLVLTAFMDYALPVFRLPPLTGDAAVGIQYFALVDERRSDPFVDTVAQQRALMVKVYYPAQSDDTKPFSPYFHASTALIRAFAQFYQMPSFVFDHLVLVQTHAKDGLVLSNAHPRYPVVLFSHGAGATMEVMTSQSEDLASHGYIVVSIDHPYVSAATAFPDRIVSAHEATTNFDTAEPAEPITQIMADDGAFVIDWLGQLDAGRVNPAFTGKLDLAHIGVVGHSVGGAVAYNMALNDQRVKAAIDIDGVVYITPKDPATIAPFLMLANDRYTVQAIERREPLIETFDATPEGQQALRDIYGSKATYDATYTKARQNINGLATVLKTSGSLYTIDGSDHMKFTDIGLFIGSAWLRDLLQIRGRTDPARCLAITQALTVAFFDRHLKGQTADTLQSVVQMYPELKNVPLQ